MDGSIKNNGSAFDPQATDKTSDAVTLPKVVDGVIGGPYISAKLNQHGEVTVDGQSIDLESVLSMRYDEHLLLISAKADYPYLLSHYFSDNLKHDTFNSLKDLKAFEEHRSELNASLQKKLNFIDSNNGESFEIYVKGDYTAEKIKGVVGGPYIVAEINRNGEVEVEGDVVPMDEAIMMRLDAHLLLLTKSTDNPYMLKDYFSHEADSHHLKHIDDIKAFEENRAQLKDNLNKKVKFVDDETGDAYEVLVGENDETEDLNVEAVDKILQGHHVELIETSIFHHSHQATIASIDNESGNNSMKSVDRPESAKVSQSTINENALSVTLSQTNGISDSPDNSLKMVEGESSENPLLAIQQERNTGAVNEVVISGQALEGHTLTVSVITLTDLDGIGELFFQWYRDGVKINGGTGETYSILDSDIGSQISVTVSYYDGLGKLETVASLSTPSVLNVNDAPTLSAVATNDTYIEDTPAVNIFSNSMIATHDNDDKVLSITLNITNVQNGVDEKLFVDGDMLSVMHGTNITTSSNNFNVTVSKSGTNATVIISKAAGFTALQANTLVNNLQYQITGNDPLGATRVVTLTEITDTGGTDNGGVDTKSLNTSSTINIIPVADTIFLTVGEDDHSTGLQVDSFRGSDREINLVDDIDGGGTLLDRLEIEHDAIDGVNNVTLNDHLENIEVVQVYNGGVNDFDVTIGSMTGVTTIDGTSLTTGQLTLNMGTYSPAAISITGGAANDAFIFTDANFASHVTLNGGAGTDTILFSNATNVSSSDLSNVSNIEVLSFLANGNSVTVSAGLIASSNTGAIEISHGAFSVTSLNASAAANATDIVLNGTGLVTLADGVGNHVSLSNGVNGLVLGGSANDEIVGGSGNDTIEGAGGVDDLSGGLGADIFVYSNAAHFNNTEMIDGTNEDATDDAVRLDAAGTYNFSNVTMANIDLIRLNQNAAGFNLTLNDALLASADANNDGADGDLHLAASIALTNTVTVNASSVSTPTNTLTIDGTNLGGADSLTGGAGNDNLSGGAGNDALAGNAGNDVINGNAGDDNINGGDGADTLTGGLGADTFVIANSTHFDAGLSIDGTDENATDDVIRLDDAGSYDFTTVTVNNIDEINLNEDAAGFDVILSNIMVTSADQNNDGTDGDLLIDATVAMANDVTLDASNVISTTTGLTVDGTNMNGNDTITGGGGVDSLSGGDGHDDIDGGRGDDGINGGNGNDTLTGGYGADTIDGGAGNDIIYADNQAFSNSALAGVNLDLWFDASDVSGDGSRVIDGSSVATWHDKSGQSYDAVQGSGTEQAAFSQNSVNGRGTLSLDGGDYYDIANFDNTVGTIFWVGVSADPGNIDNFDGIFGNKNLGPAPDYQATFYGAGTFVFSGLGGNVTFTVDGQTTSSLGNINNYHVVGLSTDAPDTVAQTVRLGHADVAVSPWNGDFAEFILFEEELNQAQMRYMQEYLSLKYGIALSGLAIGFDTLTGGTGNDTFTWTNASHSGVGGGNRDIITDFTQGDDTIDIEGVANNLVFNFDAGFVGNGYASSYYSQGGGDTILHIDYGGDGLVDMEIELDGTLVNLDDSDLQVITPSLDGTTGVDNLVGTTGDDVIYGRENNDTVVGGEGNDILQGHEGDDVLSGGRGEDLLLGNAGADILTGGYGGDTLNGGAGNDRIIADGQHIRHDSIAGMSLWLNASTISQSFGSTVSLWEDQSGNNYDAIAYNTPTFTAEGIGNRHSINFSGGANGITTGDYFDLSQYVNDFADNAEGSIFIVSNYQLGNDGVMFAMSDKDDASSEFTMGYSDPLSTVGPSLRNDGAWLTGGAQYSDSDYAVAPGSDFIFSGNQTNAAGGVDAQRYYINGLDYYSDVSGAWWDDIANADTLRIGNNNDTDVGYQWHMHGEIAEIIVFETALSDEEIDTMHAYLSYKYSIDLDGNTLGSDVLTGGAGSDTFVWSNASHSAIGVEDSITDFAEGEGDLIELTFDETLYLTGSPGFNNAFTNQSGEIITNGNDFQIDWGGDGTADFGITLNVVANTLETDDFIFHNVVGSDGDDTLNGSALDDTLLGGRGDDILTGGNGNDALAGGYGGDTIGGGAGNDRIVADGEYLDLSSLGALTLHFDASDLSSIVMDSANRVSDWIDTAGVAQTVTASGAARPTYATNILGGRSVIDFANTQELNLAGVNFTDIVGLDSGTFFMVNLQDGAQVAANGPFGIDNGLNDRYVYLGTWGDTIFYDHGDAVGGGRISKVQPGGWDDTFHITEFYRNQNNAEIYLEGSLFHNGLMTDTLSAGQASLEIGNDEGGATGFSGDVAEVIMFSDAISDSSRDLVNEYLSFKYSLQLTGQTFGSDVLSGGSGADTFVWTNASHSAISNEDSITDFSEGDGDLIELTFDETLYITGANTFDTIFNNQSGEIITNGNDLQIDWGGDGVADFGITLNVAANTLETDDFLFHNVVGSDGDDTLNGSTLNDNIDGAKGDDILNGNEGDDVLVGGHGADTIDGGAGDDIIYADNIDFDNTAIANMRLWLDAADMLANGSVIKDGTAVTTWNDKSGEGNNLTGTGLYDVNDINGRQAVDFDGGSDIFSTIGAIDFTASDNLSIFMMMDNDTAALADATHTNILELTNNYNVANDGFLLSWERQDSSGRDGLSLSTHEAAGYNIEHINTYITNPFITSAFIDKSQGFADEWTLNIDGQSMVTSQPGAFSHNSTGTFANSNIYVGGRGAGGAYYDGRISEILIFDTRVLSAVQIAMVEEYLSYKYDVVLNGLSFGTDVLTGGAGSDTFVWSNASHSGVGVGNRDQITDFTQGEDTIDIEGVANRIIFNYTDGFVGNGLASSYYTQGGGDTILHIDFGDGLVDMEIELDGTLVNLDAVDVLTDSSIIYGTTGNDVPLNGTVLGETIYALAGDDTVNADDGNDYVHGYSGNDTLNGERGDDILLGGDGNDTLVGGYGGDTLIGEDGNDRLIADNNQFDDSLISGMALWLDASDIFADGRLLSAGTTISTWYDKSGSGNDATAFNTPTFGYHNGIGSMQFASGDQDYFTVNSIASLADGDYTLFTVFDSVDYANHQYPFGFYDPTGDNNSAYLIHSSGVMQHNDNVNLEDIDNTVNYFAASSMVFASAYDGAGTISNWRDGLALNNITKDSGAGSTLFSLGMDFDPGPVASDYFNGDIQEFMVFDSALSVDDMAIVEEYLSFKYSHVLNGQDFGADELTGGAGADTFVWTNASHSAIGNEDSITDFSEGDGDLVELTFEQTLYLTGSSGFYNAFTNQAGEIITNGNDFQIDWGGDGSADFGISLNVAANSLETDDFLFHNVVGSEGDDTLNGSTLDDNIDGARGDDTINGNDGDDILTGGYGGDIIDGGAGNDIIYADNQSFTNSSVNGMQLWLDASDIFGNGQRQLDNTSVTTWNDKSGQGNNTTSGNTPTYVANDSNINDRASITFDGDFFSDVTLNSVNNEMTAFIVANANNTGAYHNFFDTVAGADPMLWVDVAGQYEFSNSAGGGYTSTFTVGNWDIIDVMKDSANNISLYHEGDLDGSIVKAYGIAGSYTLDLFNRANAQGYQGSAAEVIFFDSALNQAQRRYVEEYLAFKYAHTLSGLTFGVDVLNGGMGNDSFIWTNASHSGVGVGNRDQVTDFTQGDDTIDIEGVANNIVFNYDDGFVGNGYASAYYSQVAGDTILHIDFGDGLVDMEIELDGTLVTLDDSDIQAVGPTVTDGTAGVDSGGVYDGTTANDIIYGRGDDDVLNGDEGDDIIQGHEGNDTLNGERGDDLVIGNAGNDTLIGGYGGDTLNGGTGNDRVIADNAYFDLSSIANLQLWLDANDINGDGSLTTSGTDVAQWNDKSGNARHATTVATLNDASYGANLIGGRGAMQFDGVDEAMQGAFSTFSMNTGLTFFVIGKIYIDDTTDGTLSLGGAGNDHDAIDGMALLTESSTNPTPVHGPLRWFGGNHLSLQAVDPGGSVFNQYMATIGAGDGEMTINGNSVVTDTYDTTGNNAATNYVLSTRWSSGSASTSNASVGQNDLSEIIIFDRGLNADEIDLVNEYLSFKYSLGMDNLTFGSDVLTGGAGADTFVWSNASHSAVGNEDTITDFSEGEGDLIELTFDDTLYITGATTFDTSFNNQAGEMIANGNDFQIDWGGDGTADFAISLNVAANTLETDDFIFHNVVGSEGDDTLNGSTLDDNIDGARGADTLNGNDGDDILTGGYGGDIIDGGAGNDIIYADNQQFTNTTIDGLHLWLDAFDINGDGSIYRDNTVSTWVDKSVNGYTLTGTSSADYIYNAQGVRTLELGDAGSSYASFYHVGGGTDWADLDGLTVFSSFTSDLFYDDTVAAASGEVGYLMYIGAFTVGDFIAMGPAFTGGVAGESIIFRRGSTYDANSTFDINANETTNLTMSMGTSGSWVNENGTNLAIDLALPTNDLSPSGTPGIDSITIGGARNAGGSSAGFHGTLSQYLLFSRQLNVRETQIVNEFQALSSGIALAGLSFGVDVLTGGTGNDTFTWTNASHSGIGGGNRDQITDFTQGDDTIDIEGIVNNIVFNYDDGFIGNGFASAYYSQSGGDTIIHIDFGDGTVDMEIELDGTLVTLDDSDIQVAGPTVSDGTAGVDSGGVYNGTTANDIIYGRGDDDVLNGDEGDDILQGHEGNDILNGERGDDLLIGNAGNDTLIGGYGGDTLNGGAGTDRLVADGQQFTSSSFGGHVLWLNASNIYGDATLVNNNENITTWVDNSGSGNDAIAGDAPSYNYGGMDSGRNSVYFDSANTEFLITPNFLNFNEQTIFVVGDNMTLPAQNAIFCDYGPVLAPPSEVVGINSNYIRYRDTDGDIIDLNTGDGMPAQFFDSTGVLSTKVINDTVYGTLNGTTYSDTNVNYDPTNTGAGTVPSIGAVDQSASFLDGDIAEMLIFNSSLSDEDEAIINLYLAMKYGVAYNGEAFGADVLTGGSGADTFVWTNASHSAVGNEDSITDFNEGEGDLIELTFDETLYITGGTTFDTSFNNQAGEMIANGNDFQIDWGGDGTADFAISLNVAANTLETDDFIFHNVVGSDGDDTLNGSSLDDNISGADGNDTLSGNDGADTINGGRGDDIINGNDGNDVLIGGYGGDIIDGGAGNDIIYADNKSFSNSSLNNMRLWLDAADMNGDGSRAAADGGALTSWADKSGEGNDFSGDGSYSYNAIGSRQGVDFNGTTDSFWSDANINFSATDKITIFTVIENDLATLTDGTAAMIMELGTDFNAVNDAFTTAFERQDASGIYGLDLSTREAGGYNIEHYNNMMTTPILATFQIDKGAVNTEEKNLFVDGQLIATTQPPAYNFNSSGNFSDRQVFIGSRNDTGVYFNGRMSEILVFDTDILSAAQMAIVDEYLSFKYGIAISGLNFGVDVLTGGTGNDTFVWTNASHSGVGVGNRDRITDFTQGDDTIDISGVANHLIFNEAGGFIGNGYASSYYSQGGGDTILHIDFAGDGITDMEIELTGTLVNLDDSDINAAAATHDGTAGNDTLNGTAAKDSLYGRDGDDTLNGNGDDDILQGHEGDDTLNGGTGNDLLIGHLGADILNGGDGDDVLIYDAADLVATKGIDGGNDTDTVEVLGTSVMVDLTTGSRDLYIDNIEYFDLNDNSNTLDMDLAHFTNITDGNDILYIDGGASDTVNGDFSGSGWSDNGTFVLGSITYRQYLGGGGEELNIDEDMTKNILL